VNRDRRDELIDIFIAAIIIVAAGVALALVMGRCA
jgi:hypothetical protein